MNLAAEALQIQEYSLESVKKSPPVNNREGFRPPRLHSKNNEIFSEIITAVAIGTAISNSPELLLDNRYERHCC